MSNSNHRFKVSYITGAHRAFASSLYGAVRSLARMLEMPHTHLRAVRVTFDGKPSDEWYVYATGECVGIIHKVEVVS